MSSALRNRMRTHSPLHSRERLCYGLFFALLFPLALLFLTSQNAQAQLFGLTGANHPELHWQEIETEHFVLVYHQGLDSIARIAAPIAEEVYHVVTTNLETPLSKRIRIYLSDNDEERNAFAFQDEYIFIWLRGILDDNLFSLRASGTSKWLRTVITHEFTHIVIAKATHTWIDNLLPLPQVPRWFNEGMARYMEPDGWTTDLDVPLRIAAVSSKLHLGLEDFLAGTLLYEGGQSLVRYIAATYGDSVLVKILKHKSGTFYDFEEAVHAATKHSLNSIYEEWHKNLNVYYNTEFGQKEDIEDVARKIPTGLEIVDAARLAPDGKHIAIIGKRTVDEATKLFILDKDTNSSAKLVTGEPGIEPSLSWSPDGKYVLFSKLRFGDHADLVYDLYRCEISSGDLERISSDARLEYPDWSPDGTTIVAAKFHRYGSDLVLLNADGTGERSLTHFNDDDVDVYSPRWSPDGSSVAFSIFRKDGMRDIATVTVTNSEIHYLTNDSINDRYPIWSPSGDSITFISFQNQSPNLYVIPNTGISQRTELHELTDAASNVLAWDWSKNKDSILITSFASRNSVQMYWLSAHRNVSPAPPVPLESKKYTAWRSVRWPLVTRPPDSIPSAIISGPYSYNSLAYVKPVFAFPLIGTDESNEGRLGTQWGLTMLLSDEMQKHLFQFSALYGTASNTISYDLEYANNQLLPTISIGGGNMFGFQNVLEDIAYYEREPNVHLGLDFIFHTPNSLIKLHAVYVGGEWKQLEPWNSSAFNNIAPEHRPIAASLINLIAHYDFLTPLFQGGVSGIYSDKKIGSDLTYARFRAFIHHEFPLGEDEHNMIAFIARGEAQTGDEIPQDFLGFYKYDQFGEGFNLASVRAEERLRGIRRYYYGNRLLMGTFELRERDELFSSLVPLLKAFEPQLVEFFDIGTTWYANAPTNNPNALVLPISSTQWLKTAGIELRSELGFDVSLDAGVGWELVKNAPADWFFRVSADL
jgi:Tol biopolymer transport system component